MGRRDCKSKRTLDRPIAGRVERRIVVISRSFPQISFSASDEGSPLAALGKCDASGGLPKPSKQLRFEFCEQPMICAQRLEPSQDGLGIERDRAGRLVGVALFCGFFGSAFHLAKESSSSRFGSKIR